MLLRKARRLFGRLTIIQLQKSEQLTIKTEDGVEVTFVYFPYKSLRNSVKTGYIPLFHLDDLSANKAYTIWKAWSLARLH